jgi:hypothetical protein
LSASAGEASSSQHTRLCECLRVAYVVCHSHTLNRSFHFPAQNAPAQRCPDQWRFSYRHSLHKYGVRTRDIVVYGCVVADANRAKCTGSEPTRRGDADAARGLALVVPCKMTLSPASMTWCVCPLWRTPAGYVLLGVFERPSVFTNMGDSEFRGVNLVVDY